ncbi:hypothetical protein STRIP9103_00922 [Streptomyces ipomoeae 91-03]|uniref:Uncharacterized protein n=1 Tax=Streptomyces ipomoeae 91-03 TaxID=698759 RepID=L1KJV9_9ACTN|nr:hypothetical protein STRIP9103_00922 [Streptomyces ipomoeae 91-03]
MPINVDKSPWCAQSFGAWILVFQRVAGGWFVKLGRDSVDPHRSYERVGHRPPLGNRRIRAVLLDHLLEGFICSGDATLRNPVSSSCIV